MLLPESSEVTKEDSYDPSLSSDSQSDEPSASVSSHLALGPARRLPTAMVVGVDGADAGAVAGADVDGTGSDDDDGCCSVLTTVAETTGG